MPVVGCETWSCPREECMRIRDVLDAICEVPAIDIHSHLNPDRPTAESLNRVLYYHMVIYSFRAADFPADELWPNPREGFHGSGGSFSRWTEFRPKIHSTSFAWILETILRDLYGVESPTDQTAMDTLAREFEERTSDPTWTEACLDRAGIEKILTSSGRNRNISSANDRIQLTAESALGVGPNESDGMLRSLRRITDIWGAPIRTAAGLREAMVCYTDSERFKWEGRLAFVAWVTSRVDFTPAADSEIDNVLFAAQKEDLLSSHQVRILAAEMIRGLCRAVEKHGRIFQLVYGTQFLTGTLHPIQHADPSFASTLGFLAEEFPSVHFNILNGCESEEPELCSLCLGYENVSLGGFWWHTFYPSVMQRAWHRRLDMVPTSRLCGFFSDGYCIDWIYGRLAMTRRVLSAVLAEKIEYGFYTIDQAQRVAREVLYETPQKLFLNQ